MLQPPLMLSYDHQKTMFSSTLKASLFDIVVTHKQPFTLVSIRDDNVDLVRRIGLQACQKNAGQAKTMNQLAHIKKKTRTCVY